MNNINNSNKNKLINSINPLVSFSFFYKKD